MQIIFLVDLNDLAKKLQTSIPLLKAAAGWCNNKSRVQSGVCCLPWLPVGFHHSAHLDLGRQLSWLEAS